jgi:ABC-type lipoprotein export system ATPase subunit
VEVSAMTMVSAEFFAPEMRDALARLRHVYKVYRIGETGVVALGGVDLDVMRGEFLAVVGPSGAGKSTILNLLGGLDRASAGAVEVDGHDLGLLSDDELTRYRATRVGFVWQGTARNLVPYLSVRENVRLPSVLHGGVAEDRRRGSDELLNLVGLGDRAGHTVGQLSGGEQQRAAIAVALSNTPAFLLADEPTAELDSVSAARVMDTFRDVNREFGVTIVMVTHDLAAARRADRRIRVRDGRILHEGSAVAPVGEDGRVRLPDEAVAMLGAGELEAEVAADEVRLRRRSETGHA